MNPTIDNAIQDLESELDAIIAGVNNPSAPAPLPTISEAEADAILEQNADATIAQVLAEIAQEDAAEEAAEIPVTVTLQTFVPEEPQEAHEPSPVSDSPEAAEASPAPAGGPLGLPEVFQGEEAATILAKAGVGGMDLDYAPDPDEPETYGTYSAVIGADVRCYLEINGISARTPDEARKLAYESAVNGNAERQGWKPSELQGEISISVGDEETDGAEFDEFESMPDPDGTPRYQTLESFVRNIAEMTSLRDIFESMPEEKRTKDQVKSADDVEVTIEEAYEYTWVLHGLIDEARKLFPDAAPKRKPASLGAAAAPVEPEPAADLKPYSITVAWHDSDMDEGFYNWAGLATDVSDAAERARVEACAENGWEPEEDEDGDANGPCGQVVFDMEGVDVWAAPDLLASLKEVTDWMRENVRPGESPEAHAMLVKAMAVIAKAECRECVA